MRKVYQAIESGEQRQALDAAVAGNAARYKAAIESRPS